MNNRYLKQDQWLDASAVGWCNIKEPERCGETWRVEYNNGYENEGNLPGESYDAYCEIQLNSCGFGGNTFDKQGLQQFIAVCTEALEMIEEFERNPKYPDYKYTMPHNNPSQKDEDVVNQ